MITLKIGFKDIDKLIKRIDKTIKDNLKNLSKTVEKHSKIVTTDAGVILKRKITSRSRGGRKSVLNNISHNKPKIIMNQLKVEIGWSQQAPHGQFLEFEPNKKSWIIESKFFKTLKFKGSDGEFKYPKKVKHVWKRSHLREHITPAMHKNSSKFFKTLEEKLKNLLGKK